MRSSDWPTTTLRTPATMSMPQIRPCRCKGRDGRRHGSGAGGARVAAEDVFDGAEGRRVAVFGCFFDAACLFFSDMVGKG